MHDSVIAWAAGQTFSAPVLEVGSYNVNGSVRPLCPEPYVGIDIIPGLGVDQVYDGETIPFDVASFATVISTEVFEHAHQPWRLAAEIVRVLQPGGVAYVTARGNGFQYHNPPDRWRFMPGTLSELFADLGCETSEEADPEVPGAFVIARVP